MKMEHIVVLLSTANPSILHGASQKPANQESGLLKLVLLVARRKLSASLATQNAINAPNRRGHVEGKWRFCTTLVVPSILLDQLSIEVHCMDHFKSLTMQTHYSYDKY